MAQDERRIVKPDRLINAIIFLNSDIVLSIQETREAINTRCGARDHFIGAIERDCGFDRRPTAIPESNRAADAITGCYRERAVLHLNLDRPLVHLRAGDC